MSAEQGSLLTPPMLRTATVSPCGTYRYDLTRHWAETPPVLWVMLNPSTADADIDDPTIRRCIGFTKSWGYGSLAVVNLYAFRSTDPKGLRSAADAIGPENDEHIAKWAERSMLAVAAWGAHGGPTRAGSVARIVRAAGRDLMCLGITKSLAPRHPLYVRGDQALEVYR